MFEVREVLRLWLANKGYRSIESLVELDRKTVKRYVAAAEAAGLVRNGGEDQLDDVFIGVVVEAVRPARPDGRGEAWRTIAQHHQLIQGWVKDDITAVKMHEFLARRGVIVPLRTLQRYVAEVCGRSRRPAATVRVKDPEPGSELQVDFGRMGLVFDPLTGRNRVCHALILTACYSRHCFVWLGFDQRLETVIAGFEAAWSFFGGVFAVVIYENVPRNIFRVLFPAALCGRRRDDDVTTAVNGPAWPMSGT